MFHIAGVRNQLAIAQIQVFDKDWYKNRRRKALSRPELNTQAFTGEKGSNNYP